MLSSDRESKWEKGQACIEGRDLCTGFVPAGVQDLTVPHVGRLTYTRHGQRCARLAVPYYHGSSHRSGPEAGFPRKGAEILVYESGHCMSHAPRVLGSSPGDRRGGFRRECIKLRLVVIGGYTNVRVLGLLMISQ
jgi:hypothetical protein